MEKNNNYISNKNLYMKNQSENKTLIINPIYFSFELIPYNKILNNIMICLQKKLSPKIFNYIYKYFIKEIKKYINKSSSKNLIPKEANPTNNKTINNIQNNNKFQKLKQNKEKKIKPVVALSFYKHDKLENSKDKKNISFSNFSNFNFNYINIKKFYNNCKYPKYNNSLNRTSTKTNTKKNNNSNSEEKDYNYQKKKISFNNNKFIMNERLPFNKIVLNNTHFNTINTSIHKNKNSKLKKIKITNITNIGNNSQHLSNNTRKKISNHRTLKNIPHQTFLDLITKSNKYKSNNNSNIKNGTISLNNATFNKEKDKNNYTMSLIGNNHKLKITNIKLQKPKNNGGEGIQKSLQTSEEMLKHIKNSLDDDNLKGMLNFSYENFLSKESERESKEYSIEE